MAAGEIAVDALHRGFAKPRDFGQEALDHAGLRVVRVDQYRELEAGVGGIGSYGGGFGCHRFLFFSS